MKKKILLLIVFSLLLSNYIYRSIWHLKYKNSPIGPIKENICQSLDDKNFKKTIKAQIVKNNFTELIIDKGTNENIKVNMICEGENGFIGLVSEVGKNYSIIKTFWYINWQLIVIDGNNNYGYLNSNGYFLYVSTSKSSESKFEDNHLIYIISNKEKSFMGTIKNIKKNIYKIIPAENILKIKKVYIK